MTRYEKLLQDYRVFRHAYERFTIFGEAKNFTRASGALKNLETDCALLRREIRIERNKNKHVDKINKKKLDELLNIK